MPFILAGSSLRVGLVSGDSILTTADSPATVTFVIGGAAIPGINKPGMDSRALYYGPLLSAAEVIIAAVVSTDYEVVRGLYAQVETGMVVTLTAAEIAAPQPGILADTSATYKLNVAPFTRYRSDGAALVSLGSGGGGGANLSYTTSPTQGVVASDSGTDATLLAADGTNAGLMLPAQFTKLAGIETGATADQTPAEIVAAVNSNLGGTGWQGGGSIVVQGDDTTVVAAATTVDFTAEFVVTETPAGEANVALGATVARILAPVTLSANTSLTSAAHANRTLRVDTAGIVLTINNDATGVWVDDDTLDIQAIGAGTFTLVQGTATLTTDSGASADSSTAVGKRVQAQRTAANAWRTLSSAIAAGGSSNMTAYQAAGMPVAAPLTGGVSGTLATINTGPITANGHLIRAYSRTSTGNENTTESQEVRHLLNGTEVYTVISETNGQRGAAMFVLERVSDTQVRVVPQFQGDELVSSATPWRLVTVSSLSAGCSLTIVCNRSAPQTKTLSVLHFSARVERP